MKLLGRRCPRALTPPSASPHRRTARLNHESKTKMSKITSNASPGAPAQIDSAGSVRASGAPIHPAISATFNPARSVARMTEIVAQIMRPPGSDRPGRDIGTNRENG
jgi:hypothetical protein